jgi:TRAP-type C4-dicarboxylate transport system substrate-binding protein
VEFELSTFAPELREAVREAADEAGVSLSEWLAQAAEAKIRADGQARILEEAAHKRRMEGLREYLDEYQAEHGAFTDEEMAQASRELGLPWPPAGDSA